MAGNRPRALQRAHRGASVVQSFESEQECDAKARRYRMERNVIVRNDKPNIPVWVCRPAGTDPAGARFD